MGSTSSKHKRQGKHGIHYQQTPTSALKSSTVFPLNPVPHMHPAHSRDRSVFIHTPNAYNRALQPPAPARGAQTSPVFPENMPVIPPGTNGSTSARHERRGIMKYPTANPVSNNGT
jgi:hypothetical protein